MPLLSARGLLYAGTPQGATTCNMLFYLFLITKEKIAKYLCILNSNLAPKSYDFIKILSLCPSPYFFLLFIHSNPYYITIKICVHFNFHRQCALSKNKKIFSMNILHCFYLRLLTSRFYDVLI